MHLIPYSGPPNAGLVKYLKSFEQSAKHSNWNDEEKVNYLPCYLAGNTLDRYLQMVASGILSQSWPELETDLIEWALPKNYKHELLSPFDHFRQGNLKVDDYMN